MYNILLIEDSLDFQELVVKVLSPIARVVCVPSVAKALQVTEEKTFDLYIVDVMLDDGDGFTLTSLFKQKSHSKNIPVIFLTSKGDVQDKVKGFKLGAEDYIVKPFNLIEFRVRIESRLQKQAEKKGGEEVVRGNLKLEIPLQKVLLIKEKQYLDLTPLQFKLLFCLVSEEKQIVSREKLAELIWGKDIQVGRSIDTHINSLRKKLGTYSKYIDTVYGAGYVFDSARL